MSSNTRPVQVFWGTDDLASLELVQRWQNLFRQKQSDASSFVIDLERPVAEVRANLQESLGSASLFTAAKMVVLKNILASADAAVEKLIGQLLEEAKPGELVVLLWHRGAPDKRRALVKQLLTLEKKGMVGITETIAPQKTPERINWLQRYWQQAGCTVETEAVRLTETATAGQPFGSLRRLAEVILLAGHPRIDAAVARQYLPGRTKPEDFGIIDALQRRDRRAALTQLAPLTLAREDVTSDAIQNFGALLWLIESGWKLAEAAQKGIPSAGRAAAVGVNPFVATKLQGLLAAHPVTDWAGWYRQAADLEWQSKHSRSDFATACEQLVWSMTA